MERKNTLLLTVIAIATLLVAVIGATFAYFASETNVEATAGVTAQTGTAASFSSSSTDAIELNITGDLMMQGAAETEPLAQSDSADLIVNLSAAEGTTCSYKIGYVNTADEENVYEPVSPTTEGRKFEFEITASYCQEEDCAAEGATWTPQNLGAEEPEIGYADLLDGTVDTPHTVIDEVTISVEAGETTAVPVTWKFTANFYNLNAPQATNKLYTGYFVVTDVEC